MTVRISVPLTKSSARMKTMCGRLAACTVRSQKCMRMKMTVEIKSDDLDDRSCPEILPADNLLPIFQKKTRIYKFPVSRRSVLFLFYFLCSNFEKLNFSSRGPFFATLSEPVSDRLQQAVRTEAPKCLELAISPVFTLGSVGKIPGRQGNDISHENLIDSRMITLRIVCHV